MHRGEFPPYLRYDSRVDLEGQEPPAPCPVVSDSEYLCIDREKEKGNEVLYACPRGAMDTLSCNSGEVEYHCCWGPQTSRRLS